MNPLLVLWDIDGTLVCMDRAGERALLRLIRDTYQRDLGEKLPVALAGRTDTSIVTDLLNLLELEASSQAASEFKQGYLALLPQTLLDGKPWVQPGIREALEAIHVHADMHQGLLTGNLREGARLKLNHLGLWDYFEFGAFANDSGIRNQLGPFAVARAKDLLGIDFAPQRVFVIGDTPHDIACGKAIGANTIGVATGSFSAKELKACGSTHVFEDLADTPAFLKVLLQE